MSNYSEYSENYSYSVEPQLPLMTHMDLLKSNPYNNFSNNNMMFNFMPPVYSEFVAPPADLKIQNLLKTNLEDVKKSLSIIKNLCNFTCMNKSMLEESTEDNFILNEMELTVKDLQYYIQLIKNIMKSKIELEKVNKEKYAPIKQKEFYNRIPALILESKKNYKGKSIEHGGLSFATYENADDSQQIKFLTDFKALKAESCLEEQMLALHMREHVVGKKKHREILRDTTSYLRSFSPYHANLLDSAALNDTENYTETDRICIVKFETASICRQVKEAFTRHIRDINRTGKTPYEDVQGFVISSPIGVRELKRSLKSTALDLEKLVNFKLPLYIGTPILDLCGGRFSKFAEDIKNELIGRTVYASKEEFFLYKVLVCELYTDANGKSERSVSWLTVQQAYKLCMENAMVVSLE